VYVRLSDCVPPRVAKSSDVEVIPTVISISFFSTLGSTI
jgi:hypothetical protein